MFHLFWVWCRLCGDPTRCPWITEVANNVASIGAAAGGAIVIAKVLPAKICRLFPKNVLQTIASLAIKISSSGTPFDPSGKSEAEVVAAVRAGRFSKSDGVIELGRIDAPHQSPARERHQDHQGHEPH